ncbi:CHAD domain-containing protein [Trinickia symbiotica]|uniref:CHAD domain-containing protein n=1 Tax=Trinickia symbiotica TaxID=863227 RepID=A0A2N7X658_9BURK|nr:CHAD domain-containing protein [Trinickia symbiotica]PMS37248.1 CHAD domain-containing protein [Trinickia symbiotica]PPK42680.1 CHAD domain-containing protein [Trinickia symbiotica]
MPKPTNTSGPPRHAVEIVLAVEPKAAGQWFRERAENIRDAEGEDAARSISRAIVDVLEHLPGIETAAADERKARAQCESLPSHPMAFRWQTSDSRPVAIQFVNALSIESAEEPAAARSDAGQPPDASMFCELRLSCDVDDDDASAIDAGADSVSDERSDAARLSATRAVFAAARMLLDHLPAFPESTEAAAASACKTKTREPVRASRIDLAGARTPHEALIAIATNIAHQWFGNERGVRESSEIEFVHQMRVSLRRAKTLIKTFPSWVDDAWRTNVEPGLQWVGAMLGEARDLDVLVDSTLPALAAADADPSAWSGVIAAADARRLEARARLQQAMRSRRYAQLSLAWLEWLANQHFSSGPPKHAGRALREYAAKRARRHYKRLTAEPPLTSLDAAGRHRRRIEAKRLRYTLEFFEPLVAPRRRRKIAKQVSRIQSVLGDANDAAAALRFLEEERLDVTEYQRGFARGWCEAATRAAAHEADGLLAKLPKPKIAREVAA